MLPRILAIAPYEGLKELLVSVMQERKDLQLSVYLADLEEGAEIAQSLETEGYDLILSRGGTAAAIRRRVSLPVAEIELSAVDTLRAIRLAEQSGERFAVVCFANLFRGLEQILSYLGLASVLRLINSEQEAEQTIQTLIKEGCRMIVGDAISVTMASRVGLPAILIQSGRESVHTALDEALNFLRSTGLILRQNSLYQRTLRRAGIYLFVFDRGNELKYSNLSSSQVDIVRLSHSLPRYVPELRNRGSLSLIRRYKGQLYSLEGWLEESGEAVISLRLRSSAELDNTALDIFHSLNKNSGAPHPPLDGIGQMGKVVESLTAFSRGRKPLALFAEPGTPDTAAVRELFLRSELGEATLITLNCPRMGKSGLLKLLKDENSPLLDNNLCFCIYRLDELDEESQKAFIQFARHTAMPSRNLLVYVLSPGDNLLSHALKEDGALHIALPSLDERQEDLAALCSLYLSQIGFETGHLIPGLQQDALTQLQQYHFPGNNAQLYRMLYQASLLTQEGLISEGHILGILNMESASLPAKAAAHPPSGTLEEHNLQVILKVLDEEGGNRSRTAARLGISRSTLWRILSRR